MHRFRLGLGHGCSSDIIYMYYVYRIEGRFATIPSSILPHLRPSVSERALPALFEQAAGGGAGAAASRTHYMCKIYFRLSSGILYIYAYTQSSGSTDTLAKKLLACIHFHLPVCYIEPFLEGTNEPSLYEPMYVCLWK